ncbi:hypothetical protein HYX01_02445 [Candidatus Woesearchaeota archaeon]|nr:hypothetical protein [Candidatus Woesearchaeota archaeon]
MKLDELALLMGKSKNELIEMLKQNDVIELNLSEKNTRQRDNGSIIILE